MIERWYKAPVACLFDVRVAKMPAGLFKTWHQLLALASLQGGLLPSVDQMAFSLRSSPATLLKRLEALAECGLAILHDGLWRLRDAMATKDTEDADAPLTGAERTKRWRERKSADESCDVSGDAAVTACDVTREEENKKDITSDGPSVTPGASNAPAVPRPSFARAKPPASFVWIAKDSPEWNAWCEEWRSTRGGTPPTDNRGGWSFPTRWPPTMTSRVAAE